MVKDRFNYYYTILLEALQEEYPALIGGTVYKDTPPSFPYLYFRQIDAAVSGMSLSNTEDAVRLSYQVDIYSSASMTEARNISNLARETMINNGFRCSYFAPTENIGDTSIHRFLARYEKIDT